MLSDIRHLEVGRPARSGQMILERRYRIAKGSLGDRLNNALMLDIGCGNGAQTVFFRDDVRRAVGVDLTPLSRAETPAQGDAFDFVLGSALELPFQSNHFDIVTSFEVLEHVPDDKQAVKEIHRVLKPGGIFFFSVPNKWWIIESHGGVVPGLNWIPWNRVPFFGWLPRPLHEKLAKARTYTMKRAHRLVVANGFEVVRSGYITAPLDVLGDSALRWLLRKTIFRKDLTSNPFLAVNLFVMGRKAIERNEL